MNLFIDLFGNLVIAILAFIPIISSSLLAIFHDGINILVNQNENEVSRTEDNIRQQLTVISKKQTKIDEKSILKTLNTLKKTKKKATKKLHLLNIKMQTILIAIPLILSFVLIQLSTLKIDNFFYFRNRSVQISHCVPFLITAGLLFCFSVLKIWKIFEIIVEVKKASDEENDKINNNKFDRVIELLEKIGDGTKNFVKNFSLEVNGTNLSTVKPTISISCQKDNSFKIKFINNETDKVVKNLEVGLILPNSFLINTSSDYSITSNTEDQIIRIKRELTQSQTRATLSTLEIRPLEIGNFDVTSFIKAENIPATYQKWNIVVN